MLRSHSPSNLPERGGALSFAQQVKLVTPEFQALISSCTKVRALLDAIVPCPEDRDVLAVVDGLCRDVALFCDDAGKSALEQLSFRARASEADRERGHRRRRRRHHHRHTCQNGFLSYHEGVTTAL